MTASLSLSWQVAGVVPLGLHLVGTKATEDVRYLQEKGQWGLTRMNGPAQHFCSACQVEMKRKVGPALSDEIDKPFLPIGRLVPPGCTLAVAMSSFAPARVTEYGAERHKVETEAGRSRSSRPSARAHCG